MTTTVSAVVLGIILVCTIQPGKSGFVDHQKAPSVKTGLTADTILDLIR